LVRTGILREGKEIQRERGGKESRNKAVGEKKKEYKTKEEIMGLSIRPSHSS